MASCVMTRKIYPHSRLANFLATDNDNNITNNNNDNDDDNNNAFGGIFYLGNTHVS